MIIDSNSLLNRVSLAGDVCIVGGGAAGIVLATELSRQGVDTVLLESGSENYSHEAQLLYAPAIKPTNYPDPTYSRMRYLGGSTNHWENNTSPLDSIDFEKRDWVPNSGWPISIDDVKPFYNRAAEYCGSGTDGYEPEYWLGKLGSKNIVSSSSVLDNGIAKASSPPVRMFNKHGSALKESKNVRIYTNANVVDVDYDKLNQRLDLVYFKPTNGTGFKHQVNAKIIIFCMGGIENARLMLHINGKFENALGNQNDNVGRYFMDHPIARAAIFHPARLNLPQLFQGVHVDNRLIVNFLKLKEAKQIEQRVRNLRMPLVKQSNFVLSDGISSYHILNNAISNGGIPDNFGFHLSNLFSDGDMVIEAISRKQLGREIFDSADSFGGYQIPAMLEQAPYRDNRISLAKEKDRLGVPKIRMQFELKQEDKDQMWKALELTASAIGALSLGRLRLLREREDRLWGDQLSFGHHHMGTTRMATSSKDGVVDSNSKVFGVKNLYISGSSVFCTGGHVPPTLTIVALSIRLANHLEAIVKHDQ